MSAVAVVDTVGVVAEVVVVVEVVALVIGRAVVEVVAAAVR